MNAKCYRLSSRVSNLFVIVALLLGLCSLSSAQMPCTASAAQPTAFATDLRIPTFSDNDTAVFSVVCFNAITVQNADDSGPGSLRQAITDLCPNGQIDFDSSLAGQTITLTAQLEITKNLTIDGSSLADPIQISGNNVVRVFRVADSAHITLDSLRIVWGKDTTANANCGNNSCGGGIKIEAGATVTLTHSAVLTSTAIYGGGGIYNAAGSTLTVLRSTLSGNSVIGSVIGDEFIGGIGGGICNNGTLTVQDSTLSSNSAAFGGGGILNGSGTLTVQDSTLSGNSVNNGTGGGIYNFYGTLTVLRSTLSGNLANWGGGIHNEYGMLTVQGSTLAGNSALDGGGITSSTPGYSCDASPQTVIINSTLSGNLATDACGGVYNFSGVTEIVHSTITANQGGGVGSRNDNRTCTHVGHSIIAGNTGSDVVASTTTPIQRFYSLDYNLIGVAGINVDFGQEFNQPHDQVNVANPALGSLADNGGPSTGSGQATLTHAPLPGSPVIDAIPLMSCTLATDQRGVSRPQPAGGNCDIGAFELYGYMIFLPMVLKNK